MKHAFLIMAHNEPYVLKGLINQINKIDGDIYIHIDKKTSFSFYIEFKRAFCMNKKIKFINRHKVFWGDYSQIQCEMALFKVAANKHYDYYHLISGIDLIIKSSEYFNSFFERNIGKEFFGLAPDQNPIKGRMNYYHLFNKFNRTQLGKILIKLKIPTYSLKLQHLLGISRCKNDKYKLYKGSNWVSITDKAVACLLNHETYIKKRFRFTYCADEIYKQTILMNNGFGEQRYIAANIKMYDMLRLIDWKRGNPYTFTINDKKELLLSENIFARKFSANKDKNIVDFFIK